MYDWKWPTLLVQGPALTREQAEQVLVRCDGLHLDPSLREWDASQERQWREAAHRILTGTTHPWTPAEPDDRVRAVLAQLEAAERRGLLQPCYLYTNRIASPAKGSARSWLDWDGTLGARAHTIGKWPGEDEITEEWSAIAAAFEFLTLDAQLLSFGNAPEEQGNPSLWGTWHLEAGAVVFDPGPTPLLDPPQVPPVFGGAPLDLAELAAISDRVLGPLAASSEPATDDAHVEGVS